MVVEGSYTVKFKHTNPRARAILADINLSVIDRLAKIQTVCGPGEIEVTNLVYNGQPN